MDILVPSVRIDVLVKAPGEFANAAAVFFRQEGTHVWMVVDGRRVLDVPWDVGDVVALALKRLHNKFPEQALIITVDGLTVLEIPYTAVDTVYALLVSKCRDAEEISKHEQISTDAAILLRTGTPIGLTDHPDIRDEVAQKAAWDSNLRRYIPGGVQGGTMFGRPGVKRKKESTTPEEPR